ncbi:copper chaperone PCu(A)C [Brevundimonas sp.]|uniref:copper chaperone PCu(A)C n=1 Tax=Brevundimonas sp. TaxID=1871086 RepID=UPI003567E535
MIRTLVSLAALALLSACQGSSEDDVNAPAEPAVLAVEVADAWCRPTPNGARAGACYATLKATGRADRLVGVSTPAAGMAMIHIMSTEDGMMKMSEAEDGVALPIDQAVTLAPGGTHLMLMDLRGPLVEGTVIALTLNLFSGPDVTVQAPVRRPAA